MVRSVQLFAMANAGKSGESRYPYEDHKDSADEGDPRAGRQLVGNRSSAWDDVQRSPQKSQRGSGLVGYATIGSRESGR